MELKYEINTSTNITYKLLVDKCPNGQEDQQCNACEYPTPFYDYANNKCVSGCQNDNGVDDYNYVDINMFCLSSCDGLVSRNYEVYEGYKYKTCGRKCNTDDGKECNVVNPEDLSCDGAYDVNYNCISTCDSGIYVEEACFP